MLQDSGRRQKPDITTHGLNKETNPMTKEEDKPKKAHPHATSIEDNLYCRFGLSFLLTHKYGFS